MHQRTLTPYRPWLLLATLFLGCGAPTTDPGPMIPLEDLFATPAFDAPQLSPDGRFVAYLGPIAPPEGSNASAAGPGAGPANLFVAPVDDLKSARAVTRLSGRGLPARDVSGNVLYRWTLDSRRLLVPIDQDGDENWNLYQVDVASDGELLDTVSELRNLTPLPGVRVELLALSPSRPSKALIAVADRAPPLGDLYLLDLDLDLDSGERELVEENPGFVAYIADHDLRPRVALALNAEGGIDFFSRSADGPSGPDRADGTGGWSHRFTVGEDDLPAVSASGFQKIVRFDRANRKLYFYDSRERDTIALVELDLDIDSNPTSALRIVAEDERVDLGGVLYHPTEHTPDAYATDWTRLSWHPLADSIAVDLERLREAGHGDFRVVSRSDRDDRWIVRFTRANQPESYWLYQRPAGTLDEMFVTTPALEGLELSEMYPVVVTSRDGMELVSYLSYPPWLDRGDGRPERPVPLVVLVHGGPSDERAQYAFGPFVHWLANRGYGVFYVNFRGSAGFGKAFVNAQRMEWGGKMHEDVLDQVAWAIEQKITEADQVAIVGGSYGGYEVLVGMTMTPDTFACGIDLVGPSNLEIFMPHWNVDTMSRVLGDPRTEDGRAFLRSRSPIRFAHQAKNPILIGQGARDSRVPQDQSDSMVAILEQHEVPVTYLLYPDEGHGLLRPENTRSFWATAEVFLGQCLGGRYRELSDELVGSSVEVKAGVDHIPGLAQALRIQ